MESDALPNIEVQSSSSSPSPRSKFTPAPSFPALNRLWSRDQMPRRPSVRSWKYPSLAQHQEVLIKGGQGGKYILSRHVKKKKTAS